MNTAVVVVVLGGPALSALLAWYVFAPQEAARAQVSGGRHVVDSTVKGGCSPSLIRLEAGTPVRLRFDRQENSDCTARVVFPDFRTSASLAASGTTTLDLDVPEPGEDSWACGMNVLHGTLIAEAARGVTQTIRDTARAVGVGPGLDAGEKCERAAFLLPGALSSRPTDVAA